jgi:hypothetical protein
MRSFIGKKCNQYAREDKFEVIRLIAGKGRPLPEICREVGTAQDSSLSR